MTGFFEVPCIERLVTAVIKNIIHNFRNMEIVATDLQLIEQAIDINVISQLSFLIPLLLQPQKKLTANLYSRKI